MAKKTKSILRDDRSCAGCKLCMLSCSLFNFGVFNPERSFIKVDRDECSARFHLLIDEGCRNCGECVRACAYRALRWEDENPRS